MQLAGDKGKLIPYYLGAVDISGLKFIQSKMDLITARALYYRYAIKQASNSALIRFK